MDDPDPRSSRGIPSPFEHGPPQYRDRAQSQGHVRDRRREHAERIRLRTAAKEAESAAAVPTWGSDLLRAFACAVFLQVLYGVTILLVRWRLLASRNGDVIDDGQLWAAILLLAVPLAWLLLLVKRSRPDNGFRRSGLLSLLLAGIAGGSLCQIVAVFAWQLLIGPDLVAGSVLDEVDADPLAFIALLSLTVCLHAAFVVTLVPMLTCGNVGLLVGMLPFLSLVVGGMFVVMWSIRLEPSWVLALGWTVAACVAIALVIVVAVISVHVRRDDPSVPPISQRSSRLCRGERTGRDHGVVSVPSNTV